MALCRTEGLGSPGAGGLRCGGGRGQKVVRGDRRRSEGGLETQCLRMPVGNPAAKLPEDQTLPPPSLRTSSPGSPVPRHCVVGGSPWLTSSGVTMTEQMEQLLPPTPSSLSLCRPTQPRQELGAQGSLGVAERGPHDIGRRGRWDMAPTPGAPFLPLPLLAQTSRLLCPLFSHPPPPCHGHPRTAPTRNAWPPEAPATSSSPCGMGPVTEPPASLPRMPLIPSISPAWVPPSPCLCDNHFSCPEFR